MDEERVHSGKGVRTISSSDDENPFPLQGWWASSGGEWEENHWEGRPEKGFQREMVDLL